MGLISRLFDLNPGRADVVSGVAAPVFLSLAGSLPFTRLPWMVGMGGTAIALGLIFAVGGLQLLQYFLLRSILKGSKVGDLKGSRSEGDNHESPSRGQKSCGGVWLPGFNFCVEPYSCLLRPLGPSSLSLLTLVVGFLFQCSLAACNVMGMIEMSLQLVHVVFPVLTIQVIGWISLSTTVVRSFGAFLVLVISAVLALLPEMPIRISKVMLLVVGSIVLMVALSAAAAYINGAPAIVGALNTDGSLHLYNYTGLSVAELRSNLLRDPTTVAQVSFQPLFNSSSEGSYDVLSILAMWIPFAGGILPATAYSSRLECPASDITRGLGLGFLWASGCAMFLVLVLSAGAPFAPLQNDPGWVVNAAYPSIASGGWLVLSAMVSASGSGISVAALQLDGLSRSLVIPWVSRVLGQRTQNRPSVLVYVVTGVVVYGSVLTIADLNTTLYLASFLCCTFLILLALACFSIARATNESLNTNESLITNESLLTSDSLISSESFNTLGSSSSFVPVLTGVAATWLMFLVNSTIALGSLLLAAFGLFLCDYLLATSQGHPHQGRSNLDRFTRFRIWLSERLFNLASERLFSLATDLSAHPHRSPKSNQEETVMKDILTASINVLVLSGTVPSIGFNVDLRCTEKDPVDAFVDSLPAVRVVKKYCMLNLSLEELWRLPSGWRRSLGSGRSELSSTRRRLSGAQYDLIACNRRASFVENAIKTEARRSLYLPRALQPRYVVTSWPSRSIASEPQKTLECIHALAKEAKAAGIHLALFHKLHLNLWLTRPWMVNSNAGYVDIVWPYSWSAEAFEKTMLYESLRWAHSILLESQLRCQQNLTLRLLVSFELSPIQSQDISVFAKEWVRRIKRLEARPYSLGKTHSGYFQFNTLAPPLLRTVQAHQPLSFQAVGETVDAECTGSKIVIVPALGDLGPLFMPIHNQLIKTAGCDVLVLMRERFG